MRTRNLAGNACLFFATLPGFASAQEAGSGERPTIEVIADQADVAAMKARGEPVDLLAAMLAELRKDYRFDLDYDDYDRFVRHEPERSRAFFETWLSDPSRSVDDRVNAAQALATIGDPRGVEYLMSRDETEDSHELTLVLRAMNEIDPVTRAKAIVAAAVLSNLHPTTSILTDELIDEIASITKSEELLTIVAARFARVPPGSLASPDLADALSDLLRSRDPEVREPAQAIRNRFVASLRANLAQIGEELSYTRLLFQHVDPGDITLLRDAWVVFRDTIEEDDCFTALVSVDPDPDLIDWAFENFAHQALAEGLLRAEYDLQPALAKLRASTGELDEYDWAVWVLLASRGTQEDRAAAKAALNRGALVGEAAFRLAAELNAVSTDEALAGLVELGIVRAEDVAMADLVLDEDRFEAEKLESLLCDGDHACLLPVFPEGDDYVVAVIHRLAGISSGKLRFESARVTSERDEDEGTGERTIELVVQGVGYRVTAPIDDLDVDEFEPDVTPLVALCNHVLEANGIEQRIALIPFDDIVLLFAKPKAVAVARERGYLPK